MADLLKAGSERLADLLKSSAGSSVTYTRGGTNSTIVATIGKSVFETQDATGIIEAWESRDFIVKTADMPYSEPQRGDTITETVGGTSCIFEVMSPSNSPLFSYGDAFGSTVRIHTKRVN